MIEVLAVRGFHEELFAGTQGGFRPISARTNMVRIGVQLSSVWVHMVPLVSCKNLTFCCFLVTKDDMHVGIQMSPIPPVVVLHLLAAGQ